ncbi:MAG: YihY/virulence factor BrkB family protein [Muribaculaceae bacterium]|nr:YihY/virulence factor BrkB family protein [Muribaculaceae bacterium]
MKNDNENNTNSVTANEKPNLFTRLYNKIYAFVIYCISGVWNDPRHTWKVRFIKTMNLSVNSFLDRGLQIRSMALTYYTVLSLVPALALLVAIARGFGLNDTMQQELYTMFPSQAKVISTCLKFVDSYLNEATSGVFVGVGIVMLLWTIISLLSYIEDAFNTIWDVKEGRSLYQKITDYIAICLIIPVLMLCSSGVSIFMSTTIQNVIKLPFLTQGMNIILEMVPLFLAWLAFTFSFYFIPTTKVNFKYAMISGAVSAIAFQILQMLFVNGQIYVSKYNAIYGSFSFLPLMLVWLQFSWMILLAGCVLTYSLQNVFTFNFLGDVGQVSNRSWHSMALITMCVVVQRFIKEEKPLSNQEIAARYNLPVRVVNRVAAKLLEANLIYIVKLDESNTGLSPALQVGDLSLGRFFRDFDNVGENNIIPDFDKIYADMLSVMDPLITRSYEDYDKILLKDIPLPTPEEIHKILLKDEEAIENN